MRLEGSRAWSLRLGALTRPACAVGSSLACSALNSTRKEGSYGQVWWGPASQKRTWGETWRLRPGPWWRGGAARWERDGQAGRLCTEGQVVGSVFSERCPCSRVCGKEPVFERRLGGGARKDRTRPAGKWSLSAVTNWVFRREGSPSF